MAALDRVAAMLDEGNAPPWSGPGSTRVDGLIRAILPRLPDLGVGSADGYAVVATATDYLPGTVGGYLRLPREWADSRPIEDGQSALMVLVDQLELLAATMEQDARRRRPRRRPGARGARPVPREPVRGDRPPAARSTSATRGHPRRPRGTAWPRPARPTGSPTRNTLDLEP